MLGTLVQWVKEYRLMFLLFILVPVTLGSSISLMYDGGGISQFYYVISIIAILLLQGGTLSMSRFFDIFFNGGILKNIREILLDIKGHMGELAKPSFYLISGGISLGLCVFIGMFIAITRSLLLLPIGMIGVGMGMFYTIPPLKQRFHIIGQLAWFLTVPLCAVGAFLVQVPIPSLETLAQHSSTFWLIIGVCLPLALIGTCGNYLIEKYRPIEKA